MVCYKLGLFCCREIMCYERVEFFVWRRLTEQCRSLSFDINEKWIKPFDHFVNHTWEMKQFSFSSTILHKLYVYFNLICKSFSFGFNCGLDLLVLKSIMFDYIVQTKRSLFFYYNWSWYTVLVIFVSDVPKYLCTKWYIRIDIPKSRYSNIGNRGSSLRWNAYNR